MTTRHRLPTIPSSSSLAATMAGRRALAAAEQGDWAEALRLACVAQEEEAERCPAPIAAWTLPWRRFRLALEEMAA
ncbi:MAG: hypothetical protein V2A73_11180 [Pseudomonadota bacterium]